MPSRFFKFGILAFAASAFAFAFALAFSAFAIFFKMFASVYGSVCGIDGSLFSGSVFARLAPLTSFSIQLGIYLSSIPSLRAFFRRFVRVLDARDVIINVAVSLLKFARCPSFRARLTPGFQRFALGFRVFPVPSPLRAGANALGLFSNGSRPVFLPFACLRSNS